MDLIKVHGANIPALGFGVFRMSDEEVAKVVPAALEAGFRHFDTAQIYQNEAALGQALAAAGAKREDLFLTTKVWVDNYSVDKFAASVEESLAKLKVEQVDLLLLHWPAEAVSIEEQIDLLNAVHAAGKTRFIGVSNQNSTQFAQSVARSAAPIITNQIEVHPYLDQSAPVRAAQAANSVTTAYYGMADGAVPKDALIQDIANKHGKTAAQIGLRWLLEQGYVVLSKTARPERVAENAAVFDFQLYDADHAKIATLARPDGRIVSPAGLAPVWDL